MKRLNTMNELRLYLAEQIEARSTTHADIVTQLKDTSILGTQGHAMAQECWGNITAATSQADVSSSIQFAIEDYTGDIQLAQDIGDHAHENLE